MFLFRKAWNYLRMRMVVVALLWLAAGGALKAINWLAQSLSEKAQEPLKTLSLGAFSDYRLIVILGLSVLAMAGLLSLILMNISPNKDDQSWVIDFLARLWDEVSSASTHAGAVLISASVFFPNEAWGAGAPPGTRWIVISLYLLIGFMAYRDEPKSQLTTPVAPQGPAAAQSAPVPGHAVASQSATPKSP